MQLLAAFVLAAGISLATNVDSARAHCGFPTPVQEVGPYLVQACELAFGSEYGEFLEYSVSLRLAIGNEPVDDATVTVTAVTANGALGPETANQFGNTYDVFFPAEEDGKWRIEVEIDGPAGGATFEQTLGVEARDEGFNIRWLALPGLLMPLIALAAWRIYHRRRERAGDGPVV